MCLVVCVVHLKDAGSSGHALQYAGLVAILEEDGSVVIYVLHFNKYSGCACPPAACWTVVYVQKRTHFTNILVTVIQVYANCSCNTRTDDRNMAV